MAAFALSALAVGPALAEVPWTHPEPHSLTGTDPLAYERWRLSLARDSGFPELAVPVSQPDSTAPRRSLDLHPVVSASSRLVVREGDFPLVASGGLQAAGILPSLRFATDARIVVEGHTAPEAYYSLDREYLEVQKRGENSNFGYISFARYRAAVDVDVPFGVLGMRRDALHVGPGYLANLTINRAAGAFPYAFLTAGLGPFRAMALFGNLAIDGDQNFRTDTRSRNLFLHRYEWTGIPTLRVGITENLIVVDAVPLEGFLPVAPLFMAKGQGIEDLNNGNLAFDLSWSPGAGPWSLYAEFLVDDVSEPTSLFNDYWKNRWAAMAGLSRNAPLGSDGLVGGAVEVYRIEPWVYNHYLGGAGAAANRGAPLGGLTGANSLGLAQSLWISRGRWGARGTWVAALKGLDRGSALRDTMPWVHVDTTKSFLGGRTETVHDWSLDVSWSRGPVVLAGRLAWSRGFAAGLTATWFLPVPMRRGG